MQKLKVEYEEIETLIPYINNSRTHSEEQVAQIAASIKEFGWTNPILIDHERTVVAGHGRLLAARKLDMKKVPVIILDYLTKAQQKALVIADNKMGLNAGWDYELLATELQDLADADYDVSLLGFSDIELESLNSDIDTSILDELDDSELDDYESNVRKAIQIEFEQEDYEKAQALIKYWRDSGAYVGGLIIDLLTKEKEKV